MMKSNSVKKVLTLLLCLSMILSLLSIGVYAADSDACGEDGCTGTYTNGFCSEGTKHYEAATDSDQDGVYEISNGGQLYWFAKQVDSGTLDIDAILTADITINTDVLVDGELNEDGDFRDWTPIGSNSKKYAGHFDGKGYTISGLYYEKTSTVQGNYNGLFADLNEGAVVENVNLADSYIYAKSNVGGIAGQNLGGTIRNCTNSSLIYGEGSKVGGIVGNNTGIVTGCTNVGPVTSENENAGGIAGYNENGTISCCTNTGAVEADAEAAGGIAGYNRNAAITDCRNLGDVVCNSEYAGGIVGAAYGGSIKNSYNTGTIEADDNVGPILGGQYSAPTIQSCYYQADSDTDGLGNTAAKTAEQFASGEVCYLLNGSVSTGDLVWYQTLGTNSVPTFDGLVVGYDDTQTPPYYNVPHTHTPGEPTQDNVVAPGCETSGSYDEVISCSDCGDEISRTPKTTDPTGHDWDDGTLADGVMTYACGNCDETISNLYVTLSVAPNESNGKLTLTGKYWGYGSDTYEVTAHGLLYIKAEKLAEDAELTLDTAGKVKARCSFYASDGSFAYNMSPADTDTVYTVVAYVTYVDPVSGETVTAYSDPYTGSYTN